MSAYVVSNKTITAIVVAMQRKDFLTSIYDHKEKEYYNPKTEPKKVGQFLLNQNYASVNFRYGEDTKPHQFKMEYKTDSLGYREDFTLGEMYGSIECYMYQSCETQDWYDTDIFHSLLSVKDDLAEKMLEKLGEKLAWGVN